MDQIPQCPTCPIHNKKIEFIKTSEHQNDSNIFYCVNCVREKQCAKNTFIHISMLQNEQTNLSPYLVSQPDKIYQSDNLVLNLERNLAIIDSYLEQIQEQAKKLKNDIIQRHNSIVKSMEQFNNQLQKMNTIFNSMQFKEQIQKQINQFTQDTYEEKTEKLKAILQEAINQYKIEENTLKSLYDIKLINKYKIFQINTQIRLIEDYLFKLYNRISIIRMDFNDKIVYNPPLIIPSVKIQNNVNHFQQIHPNQDPFKIVFPTKGMHMLTLEVKKMTVQIQAQTSQKSEIIYDSNLQMFLQQKIKILLDYDLRQITVLREQCQQRQLYEIHGKLQMISINPYDESSFEIIQCI